MISSQIALHTQFGGVVPEIASRKHIEKINQVVTQALEDAKVTLADVDAIGVTYGPGLVGALLVGVAEAKAIAFAAKKPLVGVHHIEGHVSANFLENPDLEPPFVCLIVSGGHTHLVIVKDYGEFEIIGRTRDDAAGEAFDKVARAVGLGYPGGPKVDKTAKEGNPHAIEFPRAKVEGSPYDFSVSGLKTAFLNAAHKLEQKGEELPRADMAASFRRMVCTCLSDKAILAAQETHAKALAMAGGVSANSLLRRMMQQKADIAGIPLYMPRIDLCTDNAAMIGSAAYYRYRRGEVADLTLNAAPGLRLL